MNFLELKDSLKEKIASAYYLEGADIFVLYSALNQIVSAAGGDFAQFNTATFDDDAPWTIKELVASALCVPFGGGKRVVVIKSTSKIKKNDGNLPALIKMLQDAPPDLCIVFFAAESSDLFDAVKSSCEIVNCGKLPQSVVTAYIEKTLKKSGVDISRQDAALVCELCLGDMGKVSGEVVKLMHLAQGGTLTREIIESNVERDYEYVVFALGDCLSRKDASTTMKMLGALLADKDAKHYILPTLYSLFSRALLAAVSDDDELVAKELGIKPFAVSKAKALSKNFSQGTLRKICASLLEADKKSKTGKAALEDAVLTAVCKILI